MLIGQYLGLYTYLVSGRKICNILIKTDGEKDVSGLGLLIARLSLACRYPVDHEVVVVIKIGLKKKKAEVFRLFTLF